MVRLRLEGVLWAALNSVGPCSNAGLPGPRRDLYEAGLHLESGDGTTNIPDTLITKSLLSFLVVKGSSAGNDEVSQSVP